MWRTRRAKSRPAAGIGSLIGSSCHVIAINEQTASTTGGNEGLGLALPINTEVGVLDRRALG